MADHTDLLQFIKGHIVPTELESIQDIIAQILLKRLLEYIQNVEEGETWEHILFSQYLFEPGTDNGSSEIMEYYSTKLTQEEDTKIVKEFATLVLATGINNKNTEKVKYGSF